MAAVKISNDSVYYCDYNSLGTNWNLVEIDVSDYDGNNTIRLVGGYSDSTGSSLSETQYAYIQLK